MSANLTFYQAMQEVLARPKYDLLTGRAINYWEIFWDAVGCAVLNLLEQITLNIPDTDYNLNFISTLFIIFTVLLLLVVVIGSIYLYLRYRKKKDKGEQSIATIFDDIANRRLSYNDLLRISQKHAEKGQYREAVRNRYIASLVVLHEKKTISVDRSKTNSQLARELNEAVPSLTKSFKTVIDIFHLTWFGKKDIDSMAYGDFKANAQLLEGEKDYKIGE